MGKHGASGSREQQTATQGFNSTHRHFPHSTLDTWAHIGGHSLGLHQLVITVVRALSTSWAELPSKGSDMGP